LRFGDNDRLSARVAQLIRTDLLILLSDVDGLYTADPATAQGAEHIPFVGSVTDEISNLAAGARAGGVGSGGMRTKIEAARIASASGCATVIASGHEERPIARLTAGARSTFVAAAGLPGKAYKQWIAGALSPGGSVSIDDGAVAALAAGKSLLPGGVVSVDGEFDRGACLSILDRHGREIARGVTAYGAGESRLIKGLGSARIAEHLGYAGPDELIHRDDLVML
ncbi:MAG TPA: glutamate 5-kinase, partial [Allosphingosinicella sp.]